MQQRCAKVFITLESYGVQVSTTESRNTLISLLHKNSISYHYITNDLLTVQSKMLSLDIEFLVGFHFCDERFSTISMSPTQVLEGSTLYSRYQIIQHALEKEFGKPVYHPLRSLLNLLNPDGTIMRWKKQGLIIEHSLQDRFGMEENVSITIL